MHRRVPAPLLFSLLSLALHLAWGWYMPAGSRVEQAESSLVELELATASVAPAPAPTTEPPSSEAPPPEEPDKLAAVPPTERERHPNRSTPRPAPTPAHAEQPSEPAVVEPAPSAVAANEPQLQPSAAEPEAQAIAVPPVASLNLSARAAALTLQAAAPSMPALRCSPERNALTPSSCGPNDTEQNAQAELNRNLRVAASKVPHLSTREKPKLQPRSDGSYAYDGHVFRAQVRRDGQVEFADNGTQVELRPSFIPFKATGDISDLVDKLVLGKELYSAEKLWFLEQTRELRDKLATAYRLEEAARARRELEKQLQRILDDRGLGIGQKHGAVFALWQDCGDDAQAERIRGQVEAFVQRFMPPGSELGFGQGELDRFNAQRVGLRPFKPYPTNAGGRSG